MRSSDLKIILVVGVAVALDQITKVMIRSSFMLHESISLIGNFLHFTYVENPGMAFGIRIGQNKFFTFFSLFASIALVIYLYRIRNEKFLPRFALALILGGAIGNLIDRVLFGQVTDFIDFGWWPVFNIADMAVSIGMVLLIILVLFDKEGKKAGADDGTLAESEEIVR